MPGQRPGTSPFSSSEGQDQSIPWAPEIALPAGSRLGIAEGLTMPEGGGAGRAGCGDRDHPVPARKVPCLAGKRLTRPRSPWLAIGRRVR